jgi:iron complex transport system substrate-binding protein
LQRQLEEIAQHAAKFPRHPRVYFEEWMGPLISGIGWVDELVEIAGRRPIFPELRQEHDARQRIVKAGDVAAREPDVILASWCGRKVNKQNIRDREGWNTIPAVQRNCIYEVK